MSLPGFAMARESALLSRTSSSRSVVSTRPSSSSRPASSALRSRVPSSAKTPARRPPSSRLSIRASRQESRLQRLTSHSNPTTFHERAKVILSKASDERDAQELNLLESWFRKKSKLFEKLDRSECARAARVLYIAQLACRLLADVLLDVVKHCEYLAVPKDFVIIQQGIEGSRCVCEITYRNSLF